MNLDNRTVVITGSAQSIGAALAARFAIEGANVVIADLDQSACEATAAQCK